MNPRYHPAMDMGDTVIVINAEKIKVTGKKYWMKYYFRHAQNKRSGAGRIGSYKIEYFKDLKDRLPERIIENAVYGMLPKGRLGKSIRVKHLKVFKGSEHPHCAQDPSDITHLISPKSRCPNFFSQP
jgi:large subunit ribosomal protein L13